MAGSYEVVTAALTNHSRALSGLAAELRGAFDAARGSSMTADAYGQLCQRFASSLDQVAQIGNETLLTGVEALRTEVDDVRDAAADYERQEAGGVARINAAGERR